MGILFQIFVGFFAVVAALLVRKWLIVLDQRKKLSWLPQAPRIPIFGALFEFRGPVEMMEDFTRLTNNPEKSSYIETPIESVIMTRNYDLVEFILTSSSILTKSNAYDQILPWLGSGLLTSTGQKWKSHRRAITPAFHFSILEQFVDIFDSNLNIMVEKLKRDASEKDKINIASYITDCALDIICETAMGVNIKAQTKGNQEYVDASKSMCSIVTKRMNSIWRGIDALFVFTADYKKQYKNLEIIHGFANTVIQKRREEVEAQRLNKRRISDDEIGLKRRQAFLDLLLNSTIDGRPLTQEEIREEVDTFMFAGHDTTATATASAMYVLANHPEIQKSIREELKELFGKDRNRPITYQDLQDLKYLELVIKEVLRLYPPAPSIARLTNEDIEYKGHVIPKGTAITIFIYGINRDPDYHENAEEFLPDRFLETGGRKPFTFIPFSAGPRNCIGQKYAILELKCMISKILMNFEILPTDPPHKPQFSSEIVLKSVNGMYVKLRECKW